VRGVVYFIIFIVAVVVIVTFKVISGRGGNAANARLRGYGVVIDGSIVKSRGTVLGPLAGARAEVTDGTSRHTLTRVVTVVGAATKRTKAAVIVTTADGGFHQEDIQGASELRRAQAWVIRFNTMAAAEERRGAQAPGPALATREAARTRREAARWDYVRRVTGGEEPECDRQTAAWMAGMILGQHAARLIQESGGRLTREQAMARAEQWVRDRAMTAGALAAAEESDGGNGTDIS
jgi:hypothetical protein